MSHSTSPLSIGIDIGGTHVKAGLVNEAGEVIKSLSIPTPTRSPAATEAAILDVIARLNPSGQVNQVGIGAAGFVDAERSHVVFAPHLAWRNEPLQHNVAEKCGLKVVVENDANAAAWAESQFGAARGAETAVVVTLGTGIGGAVIIDSQLRRGTNGMAGEFGHMMVVPQGKLCECGNRGCWEQYAGGNSLIARAREVVDSTSPRAVGLFNAVNGDCSLLTGKVVTECALAGDQTCLEILEDLGTWLGLGLANLSAALDPEIIVVGGGVSAAGELILEPARKAYARALTGRGFRPNCPIEVAQLGNEAGFIGAADLARR